MDDNYGILTSSQALHACMLEASFFDLMSKFSFTFMHLSNHVYHLPITYIIRSVMRPSSNK